MFLIISDENFDILDGCMFRISKASKKTEEDSEDESNKISSNQGEEDEEKLSLLACEQALQFGRAKQGSRERAIEGRSREGQRISHKFSFPPRKPRTPQSMKTVAANVPIRKVITFCQVETEEGA